MSKHRTARERWGEVGDLIERWLKERQDLIVQYCGLSGVSALSDATRARERLQRFCQVLVDYVSAGHFEVYGRLVQEARELDEGGLEWVSQVYPRLTASTRQALAFNDRFDAADMSELGLKALHEHLSRLGEALEERFSMEDLLIESLHRVHASKVA